MSSSYECQEPGCTYNAHAAGPILTDEDMEMQDHMDEEIRNHEERHREEKEAALADSYWVQVNPDVARWLDGNGLMQAHLDVKGKEVSNPLFVPGCRLGEAPGTEGARCGIPDPGWLGVCRGRAQTEGWSSAEVNDVTRSLRELVQAVHGLNQSVKRALYEQGTSEAASTHLGPKQPHAPTGSSLRPRRRSWLSRGRGAASRTREQSATGSQEQSWGPK